MLMPRICVLAGRMRRIVATLIASSVCYTSAVVATTPAPPARCASGAYRLSGGGSIVLSGIAPGHLSYSRSDGERGELDATNDGYIETAPRPVMRLRFTDCEAGRLSLSENGSTQTGQRIALPSRAVRFRSGEIMLAGTLVLPPAGRADAIVVWVTGSDQAPDVDDIDWQYLLPMRNVGIFVLDKRGTGGSSGERTANFHLRAADVVAAVAEVRRLTGSRTRVGLFGVSQGGWVAPLAATMTRVDFVVVGYGLAEGVPGEDRDQMVQNLRRAGFGDDAVAQAMRLQAAATRVVMSHWQSGWEAFDAVREEYRAAPWTRALGTDGYTGVMMQMPTAQIREMGPRLDQGISFEYDPLPTIRRVPVRQLWILGGSDREAPSARTRTILADLQRAGANLDLVVFPRADHGITERETVNGVVHVRASAGYWDLVASWISSGRIPALPPASGALASPHRD